MPAAGRPVSGLESQAGGAAASSEGETGQAGLQRASVSPEAGTRQRLTFIQHKHCMLSLAESFLPLSFFLALIIISSVCQPGLKKCFAY